MLGEHLDNGTIDFVVRNVVEQLYRVSRKNAAVLHTAKSDEVAMRWHDGSDPMGRVFQACLDLNIIYKSKYFDVFHTEHGLYQELAIKEYLASLKKEYSWKQAFRYRLFLRSQHSLRLGHTFNGYPPIWDLVDRRKEEWLWRKASEHWEFTDLYYRVVKPEDSIRGWFK